MVPPRRGDTHAMTGASRQEKKRIGDRIAEARRAKGLTQRALAELVGVGERAVQAWEQGETHPYRRLPLLERALGCNRSWLLGGAGSTNAEVVTDSPNPR